MNIKLAGNHINVTVYSECYVLKLQIEIMTSWNISLIFIFILFCRSLVAIKSGDINFISLYLGQPRIKTQKVHIQVQLFPLWSLSLVTVIEDLKYIILHITFVTYH